MKLSKLVLIGSIATSFIYYKTNSAEYYYTECHEELDTIKKDFDKCRMKCLNTKFALLATENKARQKECDKECIELFSRQMDWLRRIAEETKCKNLNKK